MTTFHYKNVRMHNIESKVAKRKVSWDDNNCKHI